jgi:hypothetical protein
VLSLPIPLRLLLAAQPELVTPVLQVVQRVVTRHLLGQAGLKAEEADSGAVTLIQRFGSAANLNIHLHCLVLDGVYRCGADGVPVFVEAKAPSDDELHALLHTVITRLMKMLTRRGALIEEMGLHAAVRVEAHERKRLEQLCRYITRPALADERVQLNAAGQVELKLKTPWRDGTTHLVMNPLEFMQRLAARATEGRLSCARATAQAAPDPLPWGAGSERQAALAGGAAGAAQG